MVLIARLHDELVSCFINIHSKQAETSCLSGVTKKLDEQAGKIKIEYGAEVCTIQADLSSPNDAKVIYNAYKEKSLKS